MKKRLPDLLKRLSYATLGVFIWSVSFSLYAEDTVYPEPPAPAHTADEVVSIYCSSFENSVNKHPSSKTPVSGSYVTTTEGRMILMTSATSNIRLDHAKADISEQTHLHFDVYSVSQNQLNFDIRDGGYKMFSKSYTSGVNIGEWTSFDIPLSDNTTEGFDNENVIRFVCGTRHQNYQGVYYFDNIYYYKKTDDGGTTAVGNINESSCHISFNESIITIKADQAIESIYIYDTQGKMLKRVILKENTAGVNMSDMCSGIYIVKIMLENGKHIDRKFIK